MATEVKKTLLICLKVGAMTINIKEKVSGDFMIAELDVDGTLMTKMKMIMTKMRILTTAAIMTMTNM